MQHPDLFAADRLERYRTIVPDWAAFLDAVSRPLPVCLWTNTLRTSADVVAEHLSREGIEARPLDWLPGAFKGKSSNAAGRSLAFVAGQYHIQEEVSLLPVALLGPRPGERVLDLCSAPGNKTAQIAVAMRNTGTVIANDRDAMRARATRGILDRLGIINATITRADAANLPDEVGRFDRVLADVPCTCEGTTRKHVDALLQSGREASLTLHRRQLAILRKAIQLCRSGGLIAYATCTYAPEENEMVVDAALREHADRIELLPARIDGLRSSPGVTEWGGRTIHPSLERSMRVWPHQNDTGGFFVALIRKKAADEAHAAYDTVRVNEFALAADEEAKWADLLRKRFGIPGSAFDAMRLHQPNNKYVAAVAAGHETVAQPQPVSLGMPLIRVGLRYPKLTTAGARLLGRLATRNVVAADRVQAREYTGRREFVLSPDQAANVSGTGYVLVAHAGVTLGVGLYLEDHSTVKSMFPKVLSRTVSD